jgi:hypothetical protein
MDATRLHDLVTTAGAALIGVALLGGLAMMIGELRLRLKRRDRFARSRPRARTCCGR